MTMVTIGGGARETSLARPQLLPAGLLQPPGLSCEPRVRFSSLS